MNFRLGEVKNMKITRFYNPEIPYSLHDMNVIGLEISGNNLIMRTESGMVRTAPHWDQVDGYLEFLDVSWKYCFATVCEGYYGKLGTYTERTFKKMYLKDFIAEFHNAGFSIMEEYYGQDRALYTGYFHKGGTTVASLFCCHTGRSIFPSMLITVLTLLFAVMLTVDSGVFRDF